MTVQDYQEDERRENAENIAQGASTILQCLAVILRPLLKSSPSMFIQKFQRSGTEQRRMRSDGSCNNSLIENISTVLPINQKLFFHAMVRANSSLLK